MPPKALREGAFGVEREARSVKCDSLHAIVSSHLQRA